jgi:hypothetical protein
VTPQFLDELAGRLRRHGVPRWYVRRVLGELRDHYDSLCAAHVAAGHGSVDSESLARRQLAPDPDALLSAIVARCPSGGRLRCAAAALVALARRRPLVTFILAPIPLMLAIGFALRFAGVLLYGLIVDGFDVPNMHPVLRATVRHAFYGCAYGVTPALALLFCHLAARSGRTPALALASCALLSLAGGMLKLDLVQCTASGSVAYFQRYGLHTLRLTLPMAVFVAHTVHRAVLARHRCRVAKAG